MVLGFSTAPDRLLLPLVRECEGLGLEVSLVPRLFESVNVRLALEHLGGLPLFGLHTIDPKGWQFALKYALDRVIATVLLTALAPILLSCALAVRLRRESIQRSCNASSLPSPCKDSGPTDAPSELSRQKRAAFQILLAKLR